MHLINLRTKYMVRSGEMQKIWAFGKSNILTHTQMKNQLAHASVETDAAGVGSNQNKQHLQEDILHVAWQIAHL